MQVFITRRIPDNAQELLQKAGFTVSVFDKDRAIKKDELIKFSKNADAIVSLLSDKITKEVIDSLPRCKIIANFAVGYNNIDVEYAHSKGIVVTNTPDILTDATADIAMSLTLACARHICAAQNYMLEQKFVGWKPKLFLGIELRNKIFGVVGAGRIGQETAKRAKAFGMRIVYYNRSKKNEFENGTSAKKVSLKKLLKIADVVSLHLPLAGNTFHLLNRESLDLLKNTAILINTARGEIVDEKYLISLLKKKKIFAAGFDVYEGEPKVNKALLKLENVVILPHIGSATFEARNSMAKLAAENIINVLNGKKPITPI
ncbi:putative 2-hydroxyacid dehydrogenase [bacterium BMS3Abin04]|nr:putative 2-hydroxyacid dehydrogenase [bacterium BMS3Abin04]